MSENIKCICTRYERVEKLGEPRFSSCFISSYKYIFIYSDYVRILPMSILNLLYTNCELRCGIHYEDVCIPSLDFFKFATQILSATTTIISRIIKLSIPRAAIISLNDAIISLYKRSRKFYENYMIYVNVLQTEKQYHTCSCLYRKS